MSNTRISRVKPLAGLIYVAPGGGCIHRVFDTAIADGSLLEVEFTRGDGCTIILKRPPAADVWLEHDDTTLSGLHRIQGDRVVSSLQRPSAASLFGDNKADEILGALQSIDRRLASMAFAEYCVSISAT